MQEKLSKRDDDAAGLRDMTPWARSSAEFKDKRAGEPMATGAWERKVARSARRSVRRHPSRVAKPLSLHDPCRSMLVHQIRRAGPLRTRAATPLARRVLHSPGRWVLGDTAFV